MYRWISGVAMAVVVLGVVGMGCGSGSDGEASSDVTKAQFVKQAEVVCVDRKKERTTAAEESFTKQAEKANAQGDFDQLQQLGEEVLVEAIIPSLEGQQEDLEDVGAPAADGKKVEKMIGSLEKGIAELEKEGFEGLPGNQFDDFEKESKEYGLKCKVI